MPHGTCVSHRLESIVSNMFRKMNQCHAGFLHLNTSVGFYVHQQHTGGFFLLLSCIKNRLVCSGWFFVYIFSLFLFCLIPLRELTVVCRFSSYDHRKI